MARQRGGLAGVWDRNKGIIKNVAPTALSFIPGVGVPLAVAARAAMEGFDRPGQGGIGFDLSEGLKGAAQGYGQAMTGQALKGMFTGAMNRAAASRLGSLEPVDMASKIGITPGTVSSMAAPANPLAGIEELELATRMRPATMLQGYKPPVAPPPPAAAPSAARAMFTAQPAPPASVSVGGMGGMAGTAPAGPLGRSAPGSLFAAPSEPMGGVGPLRSMAPAPAPAAPSMASSRSFNMTPSLDDVNRTVGPLNAKAPGKLSQEAPGSWWKSKEALTAAGQAAGALSNVYGAQRSAAMQQEEMDRQRREAEARAELMALFAPGILAGYQGLGGYNIGGR